jgi:hypothetical protein
LNPLRKSKSKSLSIVKKFYNLVKFGHLPKFKILWCDKPTPLKMNLAPEIRMDQKRNSARFYLQFIFSLLHDLE